MSHTLKVDDSKDPHIPIPAIYIENNCFSESSALESPPCGLPFPFFVPDSDTIFEQVLPFHIQASRFLCWFSELTPPKQFLFTALSLQHLSRDYMRLAHSVTIERMSEDSRNGDMNSKACDLGHLNNLNVASEDFCSTLLDLLSSLNVPRERDSNFLRLHDKYLSLVDKALECASQQKPVCEDAFDSLEGQLLITAMTTPLFSLNDRQWLINNIKARCDGCPSTWQAAGLLSLANDLLETFEAHKASNDVLSSSSWTSVPRNFRSSSINSPFPFLPRTLCPFANRRHHSLIPPTTDNSLNVPSPFTSPHLLSSSSSLNSSGFVSGSESMYQGLNEPPAVALRGNRLAPPPNNRLYFLRRQSASPYTPQEEQLKEEEDIVSPASFTNTLLDKFDLHSCLIPRCCEDNSSQAESSKVIASPPNLYQPQQHLNPPPSSHEIPNPPATNSQALSAVTTSRCFSPPPPPQVTNDLVVNALPANNRGGNASESSPSSLVNLSGGCEKKRQPPFAFRRRVSAISVKNDKVEDLGMAYVPVWLKSLRLHKYVSLFKHLTYSQMLGITDEWLQRQQVTQGARNKILVSIGNLSTRSATLTHLEARISAAAQSPLDRGSCLRGCLGELRSVLQTPFPPSRVYQSASPPPHCLSSTSSAEDSAPPTGPTGNEFPFGSDIEDYVEDEGVDEEDGDDERELLDLQPVPGGLCQCPYTSSDTCLFDRSNSGGRAPYSPKRPKSSEGGSSGGASGGENFFFPASSSAAVVADTAEKTKEPTCEENLSDQIMRCLQQGLNALLSEPVDSNDNYGFFMRLLALVLDHPSFNRSQKDQVTAWQKQLIDRLGPAPQPRRSYHHHRASSRRSHHYSQPPARGGGSYSAPYLPRGSVGCGALGSRLHFASPLRPPYHHAQHHQPRSAAPSFLQAPSPLGMGTHWSGGMVRGRSTEPDVFQRQQVTPRLSFQERVTSQQQQRVASLDSLPGSTPFGPMEPRMATQHVFGRNRMSSYHGPLGGDMSVSNSAFTSPALQPACCFGLSPAADGDGFAITTAAAVTTYQPSTHPAVVSAPPTSSSPTVSDYSTAEINRNLDLLTEKVTKLAIDESDSPSE
uniref:SAM domain-containing protein n=1 Tax=Mesocestoides corti TaxID=53468 RepID=A0A5K3F3M4_MESCO